MAKYKKATEQLVEDFVNKVFRAIGSAIRPAVLKHLSNKDPEFGKLVKDLEKSRGEIDSYLKTMLFSVDANSDQEYINNFVDNEFLSRDSLAFRKYLNEITPDMDMTTMIVDSAGKETEVTIPVTVRFFWPNT